MTEVICVNCHKIIIEKPSEKDTRQYVTCPKCLKEQYGEYKLDGLEVGIGTY